MLKVKSLIVFILVLALGVAFLSCNNPWMADWWLEPKGNVDEPDEPVEPDDKSGDNFAVVIFNTDGGTIDDGSTPQYMKVAYGGTVGRLRPVNRGTDGFLGWFDEEDELWDVETRIVSENDVNSDGFIILKIKWQISPPLIYTVDFVTAPAPSMDTTISPQYIGAGAKAVQPVIPLPLSDGRAFAGWYLQREPDFQFEFDFRQPPAGSITLYARWEFDTRKVIFEPNGGLRPDGLTELTREYTVALSYGLIQDPGPLVKEGFHFAGWFLDDKTFKNQWDFAKKITDSDVPQVDPLKLYAKWEINVYYVNFVITPSAAEPPARQSVPHGENAVKPSDLPMLGDGRRFFAWYTDEVLNDQHDYNNPVNQWDFNNPVTSNITLYARYVPQTRTVHFQPNGGVTASGMEMRSNFTIPIASGIIMNPGSLFRAGFTFGGWYIDPECTAPWNFAADRVTVPDDIIALDPMYLYAKWTTNPYTVTFNFYEAANPLIQTQSVEHGQRAVKPDTPENTGRALVGWFLQDGRGSGDWGIEWDFDTSTVTSSITLHAQWDAAEYTVVFHFGNPNGASPHSVYFSANVHNQIHHIYEKVTEPFMPPLPSGDTTSWSFVRWDYHSNRDADPADVNESAFRVNLSPWNFNTEINDANTSTVGKVLNLYARWIPPDPDMVWVPRGSFIMGESGVSGSPAAYHAYPTRVVTLDGFFISRYPVTQINSPDTNRGYQSVMGVMPSQFSRNTFRPVERVSWYDAIEYCIKLTDLPENSLLNQVYEITGITRGAQLPGTPGQVINPIVSATVTIRENTINPGHWNNGYRLPTEAEWEYAAKGGNGMGPYFAYAGSNDATEVAWYNETVKNEPAGLQATQTVGRKKPNALGIYDMSGNVSEWVWDWFGSYTSIVNANPPNTPYVNPRGPITGTERVRRGGGWSNAAGNVRLVVRNSDIPGTATWVNGFRIVRGPSEIW